MLLRIIYLTPGICVLSFAAAKSEPGFLNSNIVGITDGDTIKLLDLYKRPTLFD